jgi:hypothetical protein
VAGPHVIQQVGGDRHQKSRPDELPEPAVRSRVGITVAQTPFDLNPM